MESCTPTPRHAPGNCFAGRTYDYAGCPAYADTIGISGGTLILGTEPGHGDQVFAPTIAGSDLVLPNLNAAIVTPGCTDLGTSITCPLAGFQELVILGGDGDDVINLSGISGLTFAITVLGGAGNDVLVGTPGNVKLFAGPGDDVLIVMPGNCFS
jgi:Ca2+-binding RTX toxin-like protein